MAISRYCNSVHNKDDIAITHGETAILSNLSILKGKSRQRNTQALTILYDYGALSTWQITNKISTKSPHSLHSTLNKSLRRIEKLGYLQREYIDKHKSHWILTFKGIVAVLILLPEPRIWHNSWRERFSANAKKIEEDSKQVLGYSRDMINKYLKISGLALDDYETWIQFTQVVKEKLDFIDFDRIKERQLLALIIAEARTVEELATILNPTNETDPDNTKSK